MHKVFEVELASENGCTQLTLPAAPYAMLDALEKLRLEDGEAPRWEILRINTANGITPYLDHESGSLFELNALLPDDEVKLLTPHLNMHQYGQAVLKQDGGTLTGHGLIERCDGQPILTMDQERTQDQQTGMELM